MPTRVIRGLTKKAIETEKTFPVKRAGVDGVSVTINIDHTAPANTVTFSRDWTLGIIPQRIHGDAMMAFLRSLVDTCGAGIIHEVSTNEINVTNTETNETNSLSAEQRRSTWEHLRMTIPGYNMTLIEQEGCWNMANVVRTFIDAMALFRWRSTDRDLSVAQLRFDIMVRSFFPNNYRELTNLTLASAQSRIGNSLGMHIGREQYVDPDKLCGDIVNHLINRIGNGDWGKF